MRGLKSVLFLSLLYDGIYAILALVAPNTIKDMLGSSAPYVRVLSGISLGFALAIWYAFRDPQKNIAIIRALILWFGLEAVILLISSITGALAWSITLTGIIIDAVLAIGLVVFYPRSK